MHTRPGPERHRRALLVAVLAALRVRNIDAPELRLVHSLLDSWRGTGLVVVGMERHGFQVSLGDHGSGQWIAASTPTHDAESRVKRPTVQGGVGIARGGGRVDGADNGGRWCAG